MNISRGIAFGIYLLISLYTHGQEYDIRVNLKGYSGDTSLLVALSGNKTPIVNEAVFDDTGLARFIGNEKLQRGLYAITIPGNRLFEVLIDNSMFFTIIPDTNDFAKNTRIINSPENQAYYDYQSFIDKKSRERELLVAKRNEVRYMADSVRYYNRKIAFLQDEIDNYLLDLVREHEGTFTGNFFKAHLPVEKPGNEENKIENFRTRYQYMIRHYFDNIDFSNTALLNTPVIYRKLESYFKRTLVENPDTIVKYADLLLYETSKHPLYFRYIIEYLTNWLDTSTNPALEKVLVYLIDNYYKDNDLDWVSAEYNNYLLDKANRLRPLLIGSKAPGFSFKNPNGEQISIDQILHQHEGVLLYFREPDCPACKYAEKSLSRLVYKYQEIGFLALSAATPDSGTFPAGENSYQGQISPGFFEIYDINFTPEFYLIDHNGTIIAKKMVLENIEEEIILLLSE
ncbi:MAG: DUF5106 domain-containing protein [Bacteroidales bacterium]